jgi:putative ABC transport system permease protein
MQFWAIIQLSWKNVWRNPLRSSVVIISVVLATWSGIFMISFFNGMTLQFVTDQLDTYTSHIQIHNKDFVDDKLPQLIIENPDSVLRHLDEHAQTSAVARRSVVQGLASSATSNFGVTIYGINPAEEIQVSGLYTYIIDGNYLEDPSRNPVFIGSELADRLSLNLRSRLVLTFQDSEGSITAGAFRVSGIFRSPNSGFNESTVYVNRSDLNRIIGIPDAVHEIAIKLHDFTLADGVADELQAGSDLRVRSWGSLSPTLRYIDGNMSMSMYIIMVIIIIALSFGIINTMLMAVLERTQELGMLRAVGMNRRRTFLMIMAETFFVTMVGAPAGLLLSWITISWAGSVGIDLSTLSQGLEFYGFKSMIYPYLEFNYYMNITAMMFIASIISAIFPAVKALKLNPVESIRKL